MNQNLTRIAAVLDRSGSMSTLRAATVSGFNEYVGKLRTQPGEVRLLLARFDDEYEIVFDQDLATIPTLTNDDLVPRGTTALFDAFGRTIVKLGEELKNMPESDRPGKVIVMVMTDGMENASQEYNQATVAALVKRQREQYSWDFLFFGANQDAILTASTLNIPAATTLSFTSSAYGTKSVMNSAAVASNMMRSSSARGQSNYSYEFPVDAREDALTDDDPSVRVGTPPPVATMNPAPTKRSILRNISGGLNTSGLTGGFPDTGGLTGGGVQTTTTANTSP